MKSSTTASAAINSPHGTVIDMESLSIASPAPTAEVIRSTTASGDAEANRDATPGAITRAHSSRLSEADEKNLERIRKERRNGFMVSLADVDFLLNVIRRLT